MSGGLSPKWTFLRPHPEDREWPVAAHEQYMAELDEMITDLESHPSIVVWVPFNEAWGQHNTVEVGEWTVKRDSTRHVNIASGGNFWPVGDIADMHAYPEPAFPFDESRFKDYLKVVGEFGGHGLPVKGHLWNTEADNWGYGGLPKNEYEYKGRYLESLRILPYPEPIALVVSWKSPIVLANVKDLSPRCSSSWVRFRTALCPDDGAGPDGSPGISSGVGGLRL
ncbi:MAG: hypothetical protein ACI9NQ_000808 [Paracoccaceae bacterium]